MQNMTAQLDRIVCRLLFVKPAAPAPANTPPRPRAAENAMSLSLLFTGMRCVLQYVVLPFFLPILGIAGGFTTVITLGITALAIIALVASLRHLWRVNYRHRWQYLAVGLAALVFLVVFVASDVVKLTQTGS